MSTGTSTEENSGKDSGRPGSEGERVGEPLESRADALGVEPEEIQRRITIMPANTLEGAIAKARCISTVADYHAVGEAGGKVPGFIGALADELESIRGQQAATYRPEKSVVSPTPTPESLTLHQTAAPIPGEDRAYGDQIGSDVQAGTAGAPSNGVPAIWRGKGCRMV